MDSSSSSPFSGSKFINLCLANWSLHLYVYSMIPLLSVLLTESGYLSSTIALAVGAFALGMILPGPFGAYLMERRKRKEVYLKALLLASLPSTAGFLLFRDATTVILLHGLQGVAFGIAQTALGTTLVNDLLLSKYRNRGDLTYAWAGRIGVPLGLLLGSLLVRYLPLPRAIGWSLVPCLLSFLLVAQTFVPIKAPVHVPVVSFDRFFFLLRFPFR